MRTMYFAKILRGQSFPSFDLLDSAGTRSALKHRYFSRVPCYDLNKILVYSLLFEEVILIPKKMSLSETARRAPVSDWLRSALCFSCASSMPILVATIVCTCPELFMSSTTEHRFDVLRYGADSVEVKANKRLDHQTMETLRFAT
jgi:hypothetical protein